MWLRIRHLPFRLIGTFVMPGMWSNGSSSVPQSHVQNPGRHILSAFFLFLVRHHAALFSCAGNIRLQFMLVADLKPPLGPELLPQSFIVLDNIGHCVRNSKRYFQPSIDRLETREKWCVPQLRSLRMLVLTMVHVHLPFLVEGRNSMPRNVTLTSVLVESMCVQMEF